MGHSTVFFRCESTGFFPVFLASDAQIIISMVICDASIAASLNESVAINKHIHWREFQSLRGGLFRCFVLDKKIIFGMPGLNQTFSPPSWLAKK